MNTKDTKDTKGIAMEKQKLTEVVLGCAVKVHKVLGMGFLEKVYENALMHELKKAGFFAEQQKPIPVTYDTVAVGDFFADIIVERKVILELKAVSGFSTAHSACCMNYLKATGLPVCLLLNFGATTLQIKRLVGETYIHEPAPL